MHGVVKNQFNILNKCVKQGKYCIRAYIGWCWCAIHVWRSMPLRCPCWKLLLSKSAQHIWSLACTFSSQPPTCHTRNFHRNNFEGNMTIISLQERIVPHKVPDPSPSSSQENRSDKACHECLLIPSAPDSGFVRLVYIIFQWKFVANHPLHKIWVSSVAVTFQEAKGSIKQGTAIYFLRNMWLFPAGILAMKNWKIQLRVAAGCMMRLIHVSHETRLLSCCSIP